MARTQAADYDKKRDAITASAAKLFGRNGFAAASISELAAECKVSKSLIYHYYASKEEILFDVMTDHIDSLLDVVKSHDHTGQPADTAMRDLTKKLLAHYVGSADAQKVLLYELDCLPQKKRDEIVVKQREIISVVQEMLARASSGGGQNNARLRAKTMLYFGMLNWTHNWFRSSGALSRDELAEMAADTILASI